MTKATPPKCKLPLRRADNSGSLAENQAAKLAEQAGYSIIAQQYTCRYGELDLVLCQASTLVFVEVKYRASNAFGGVLHSITPAKQRKLVQAALCYVAEHPHYANYHMRFDAMLFAGSQQQCQWLEAAFIMD